MIKLLIQIGLVVFFGFLAGRYAFIVWKARSKRSKAKHSKEHSKEKRSFTLKELRELEHEILAYRSDKRKHESNTIVKVVCTKDYPHDHKEDGLMVEP